MKDKIKHWFTVVVLNEFSPISIKTCEYIFSIRLFLLFFYFELWLYSIFNVHISRYFGHFDKTFLNMSMLIVKHILKIRIQSIYYERPTASRISAIFCTQLQWETIVLILKNQKCMSKSVLRTSMWTFILMMMY